MSDIKYNIIKTNQDKNIDDGYKKNKEEKEEKEEFHGELLHQWCFEEYIEHKRGKAWYIITGVFLLLMSFYCIKTNNFLFLVILIMSLLFVIMFKNKKPELLSFSIYEYGITMENVFFSWDDMKEYYIIYEPENSVKKIYFIFKKITLPPLVVELKNENPLLIRETLNKYIQENTVRKYEHLSDRVERFFKL